MWHSELYSFCLLFVDIFLLLPLSLPILRNIEHINGALGVCNNLIIFEESVLALGGEHNFVGGEIKLQNSQQDAVDLEVVDRFLADRTVPAWIVRVLNEGEHIVEIEALVMSAKAAACRVLKILACEPTHQRYFNNFAADLLLLRIKTSQQFPL